MSIPGVPIPNTMKQCPECSADYEDSVGFCAKDGRSLVTAHAAESRLCPHCANGVAEDATQCPYCKADLVPDPSPEWLIRDERPFDTRPRVRKKTALKIVFIAGIVLCVLAAGLFGMGNLGNNDSSATQALLQQKSKELQSKEEHIKALETELKKVRLENEDITKEAVALKARLEERQKAFDASEQRLSAVKREMERSASRRTQAEPRSNPRPVERAAAPVPAPQRPAQPGVYETLRATEVHERPAQSSRVITRINGGTRINVVGGDGEWLEVVSKRGNPPGFVLRADARSAGTSNN
jgi:hypothetical protein